MRVARWIYGLAAVYGLLILSAGFFTERMVEPAGLAHPEFFYGFYGSALVWQLVFALIALDPVRFRILMPVTFLEKLAFFGASLVLFEQGRMRIEGPFIGAMIDGVLMLLFVVAWLRTPKLARS